LGTGNAVSIGEIFKVACSVLGVKARAVREARRMRPDASEVLVLKSDPSLAKRRLGWKARTTLDEGIRRTADWFRSHRGQYSSGLFHV
jgi:UDP-glucose 4-epimerase